MMRPAFLLLLTSLVACPKATPENMSSVVQEAAKETVEEGRIRVEVDVDGRDGPEVINYYVERDGRRALVEKQADFEGDGVIELRTVFDEAGVRVREELNTDFDKGFDWIDTFNGGVRATTEIDTDGSNGADLRKIYNPDGTLTKEWIVPKRGQETEKVVEQRTLFGADRQVICIERDKDMDGIFDEKECPGRAGGAR
jgi:hypothetical protein